MKRMNVLVTGAGGHLGRRVVELLLESKACRVVAGTRRPDQGQELAKRGALVRKVDFDDPRTLAAACLGVDRVLLISTDATVLGRRGDQHERAIKVLATSGIGHVVYTSLAHSEEGSPVLLAGDHVATERALAESGLGYTILRNNLYTDLLTTSLPNAVVTGQLFAAAGTGGAAYVTRANCARAAVAALLGSFEGKRTLELTGPHVVTFVELAELASEVSGKRVEYVPMEADALVNMMVTYVRVPEPMARLWASFDVGMARGFFGPATGTYRELTGEAPTSVAEFVGGLQRALVGSARLRKE